MKKINLSVIIIISIISLITELINPEKEIAFILKDLSIVLTLLVPYIFEKVFKKNLNEDFKLIWIIFIFMAHYLGVIAHFYDKFYYFDKIVHTISGILTAYVAMLILDKKAKNSSLSVLFIVSFSALCAVSWEIFEFTCNILVGGDAQRVALTGVDDTMIDMIVAIIGSLIFGLYYHSLKRTPWRSFTL